MIAGAGAVDFEVWLRGQCHRGDDIGELARQLPVVCVNNLPPALRPAMTRARIEFMGAGPVLAGGDVVAKVAEIRKAAGLRRGRPAHGFDS